MKSTLTGNKNIDIEILNQLDDRDLVAFCSTSKYAKQLCNDQILWQRRLISKFGDIVSLDIMKEYKGDRSWSEYYIELIQSLRGKTKDQLKALLAGSSVTGRLDFVILTINQGVNIHVNRDLALRRASEEGHLDVVKYLVENGANIHAVHDDALGWASANGHLDVVKYLVENGANIHVFEDHPLRSASEEGHLDVVKYLVENGANIHAGNDYALRLAKENKYWDVVTYLEEQMKNKFYPNNKA